jgi:hypothetical protein
VCAPCCCCCSPPQAPSSSPCAAWMASSTRLSPKSET